MPDALPKNSGNGNKGENYEYQIFERKYDGA